MSLQGNVEGFSIEELEKELERRKVQLEEEQQEEEEHRDRLYVFMYGTEGCEGLQEIGSEKDISSLRAMELRARFNSHRQIKLYYVKAPMDKDRFYAVIDKFPKVILDKSQELNF